MPKSETTIITEYFWVCVETHSNGDVTITGKPRNGGNTAMVEHLVVQSHFPDTV
jgi:hypothetical protein